MDSPCVEKPFSRMENCMYYNYFGFIIDYLKRKKQPKVYNPEIYNFIEDDDNYEKSIHI